MAKLNVELLKRLRTRFLRMRHEEHFQMPVIAVKTDCGAAMCVAGHILDLAGYKMRLREYDERSSALDYDFITPAGRKVRSPLNTAAREIGLTYRKTLSNKAYNLFHDYDLETPKQAAARIQELIESARGE